jgi:hypothetical protein
VPTGLKGKSMRNTIDTRPITLSINCDRQTAATVNYLREKFVYSEEDQLPLTGSSILVTLSEELPGRPEFIMNYKRAVMEICVEKPQPLPLGIAQPVFNHMTNGINLKLSGPQQFQILYDAFILAFENSKHVQRLELLKKFRESPWNRAISIPLVRRVTSQRTLIRPGQYGTAALICTNIQKAFPDGIQLGNAKLLRLCHRTTSGNHREVFFQRVLLRGTAEGNTMIPSSKQMTNVWEVAQAQEQSETEQKNEEVRESGGSPNSPRQPLIRAVYSDRERPLRQICDVDGWRGF